jgi:hypothetical protein
MSRPRLVALLLTCAAIPALAQDQSASPALKWELKGLSLGSNQDQVLAAFPNAECEAQSFDPALTTCMDWNNTVAGRKSVVMIKLLEGKVVYIDLGNIDLDQAKDAAAALVAKFGPATSVVQVEGQTSAANRRRGIYTFADTYSWVDGDVHLEVIPFSWTNKQDVTYASVVLRDDRLHDRQWIVRYNNQGRQVDDL